MAFISSEVRRVSGEPPCFQFSLMSMRNPPALNTKGSSESAKTMSRTARHGHGEPLQGLLPCNQLPLPLQTVCNIQSLCPLPGDIQWPLLRCLFPLGRILGSVPQGRGLVDVCLLQRFPPAAARPVWLRHLVSSKCGEDPETTDQLRSLRASHTNQEGSWRSCPTRHHRDPIDGLDTRVLVGRVRKFLHSGAPKLITSGISHERRSNGAPLLLHPLPTIPTTP